MNNSVIRVREDLKDHEFRYVQFSPSPPETPEGVWRCDVAFEYGTIVEGKGNTPEEALSVAIAKYKEWVELEREPRAEVKFLTLEEGITAGIVKTCKECRAQIWCVGVLLSCPKCGAVRQEPILATRPRKGRTHKVEPDTELEVVMEETTRTFGSLRDKLRRKQ